MTLTKSTSARIWAGDLSALHEIEQRYLESRDPKTLFQYVCALYSFRTRPLATEVLCQLEGELRLYEEKILSSGRDADFGSECIDRAEMLCTYYIWFSKRPEKAGAARTELRTAARDICEAGLVRYEESGSAAHTYCFLGLHLIELCQDSQVIENTLAKVMREAPCIKQAEQQSRAYRNIGRTLRTNWWLRNWRNWFRGFGWGVRACRVPGIPFDVQKKNIGALLGIER